MNQLLTFDIGGSSIKTAIIKEDGTILKKDSFPVPPDFATCIETFVAKYDELKQDYQITGIAISAPGAVDSESGIINGLSAVLYIHGPNWKEILNKRTGLPIAIENDANCAALGEMYFGEGKDVQDLLYVVLGTGVGGAVIKERTLHKGTNLFGGEFGYMVLQPEPPLATWSEIASTVALSRHVNADFADKEYTTKEIFESYDNGEETFKKYVENFLRYNALGIYNLQYVYDPELILIGGGISQREQLPAELTPYLQQLLNHSGAEVLPTVKLGKFKDDANLLGAVANWLMQEVN